MISRKNTRALAGILGLLSEALLFGAFVIETKSRPTIVFLMVLVLITTIGGAFVARDSAK